MMKALIIFLAGFGVCLMISIPLVAWAVRLEDEENGIIKEKKERFRDMPKIVATAAALSMFWFLSMPLYFLMLREKIKGKGKGNE